MKKGLGIFLLVLAAFLTMSIFSQFTKFITDVITVFAVIAGNNTEFDLGYAMGILFFDLILIGITTIFWIFGIRLIKKSDS